MCNVAVNWEEVRRAMEILVAKRDEKGVDKAEFYRAVKLSHVVLSPHEVDMFFRVKK